MKLSKGTPSKKDKLKNHIDEICKTIGCIEMRDIEITLQGMLEEGLVSMKDDDVQSLPEGVRLGKEWESLLMKKEPIIEVVAGIVDGSITGLVVVLSAFVARLTFKTAAFAAFLTLSAVAITNFSSFLLGGITEDLADMSTLQNLMHYSLSDIPDLKERETSLNLLKRLFTVLHGEISRANVVAATMCGTTTFLAGIIPILAFIVLPPPVNVIISLALVMSLVGVFLVRYRSRRTKVHWKITLLETLAIVLIATVISLLLGGIA